MQKFRKRAGLFVSKGQSAVIRTVLSTGTMLPVCSIPIRVLCVCRPVRVRPLQGCVLLSLNSAGTVLRVPVPVVYKQGGSLVLAFLRPQ